MNCPLIIWIGVVDLTIFLTLPTCFDCLQLAAQATITEVNGKAAACVSGVLNVKRTAFVLEPSPVAPTVPTSSDMTDDSKLKGSGKRKASAISDADTSSTLQSIDYKEKSNLLLGQVDEDRLMKQVKTVRNLVSSPIANGNILTL